MDELQRFLQIIEAKLAKKYKSKKKRQEVFKRIKAKYEASHFFEYTEQEDECCYDMQCEIANCFGDSGFAGLSSIPRVDRVEELRNRYAEEVGPVFPMGQTLDPLIERGLFGRTLLHQAVVDDDFKTVTKLVKKGADREAIDNGGCTPLQLAALSDNQKMIDHLLKLN